MQKFILFFLCLATAGRLPAQTMSSAEVDKLAEDVMRGFKVPGIAIGIIKDGRVIHSRGYGFRALGSKAMVSENTVFEIASNTKAFTAAAVGILVDEGKLQWDDKVRDYIPEFKLYDPYVSDAFTIRDLLSHHSGLAEGAGDLMILPDSTDFSIGDIIYNMRYLKPAYGFRTRFGYSNLLYAVAGEVVKRVSGMSYEDFIEKRIMRPLGMNHSAAAFQRLDDTSDLAEAHAEVDGRVSRIPRNTLKRAHAAGGINASLADMEKWVMAQLNNGKFGDKLDKQLFSERVHDEMWTPQTLLPVYRWMGYDTKFAAYGMGFEVFNIMGNNRMIRHIGSLDGMLSEVVMIPELRLGFIILTNQEAGLALTTLANQIKDRYLGMNNTNRYAENQPRYEKGMREDRARKISIDSAIDRTLAENKQADNNKFLTGTYVDPWLGEVEISSFRSQLVFKSFRSKKLIGELYAYKGSTYVVKWHDRHMNANAFVYFSTDEQGKATGFMMKAISPDTDFSFDFRDLDFKRK
jgi:CubicO group peptidase (beta-lactamase class C family)